MIPAQQQHEAAPITMNMTSLRFAIGEANDDADRNVFVTSLEDVVPSRFAQEYAGLLVHHAISAACPPPLTAADLEEVGIRLGHRDAVATALADMRRLSLYKAAALPMEDDAESAADFKHHYHHHQTAIDDSDLANLSDLIADDHHSDHGDQHNHPQHGHPPVTGNTLRCRRSRLPRGDEWLDWSGMHRTWDGFISTIRTALVDAAMPEAFIRMFYDNKPMPFSMMLPTCRGRMAVGLLLRVPLADITVEPTAPGCSSGLLVLTTNATTLHHMANRLVIIYEPATATRRGRLFTFRKDRNLPWVMALRKRCENANETGDETANKLAADEIGALSTARTDQGSGGLSLNAVATRLLRDSIDTFRDPLQALRQELEVTTSLPDSFRPREVVKSLSRIQRQAAVMRRCLAGNEKVLKATAAEGGAFGTELNSVIALVEDLKEVADELEQNAVALFNLRLAMIEFKSQTNMKLFTNMTVVIAPLSLVTGWFGMNFDDMEELHIHGFYWAVAVFAFLLMLSLGCWLYYVNRDRTVTARDLADARVVLGKAEGDEDD